MPRVEFDLTRKPYGRHQEPKVIAADNMPKADVMTDAQFDALYESIKAGLGDKWRNTESFPCREKAQREREAAGR